MIWKIYKYKCDEMGRPYGDIVTSMCYTQELMNSYKGRHFVTKIEEVTNNGTKLVWQAE